MSDAEETRDQVAAGRMAANIKAMAMAIETVISVDDSYALGEESGAPNEVTEELAWTRPHSPLCRYSDSPGSRIEKAGR